MALGIFGRCLNIIMIGDLGNNKGGPQENKSAEKLALSSHNVISQCSSTSKNCGALGVHSMPWRWCDFFLDQREGF